MYNNSIKKIANIGLLKKSMFENFLKSVEKIHVCKILTRITGTLYKSKRILITTTSELKKGRIKSNGQYTIHSRIYYLNVVISTAFG
jgi:vacuolar-type H+-ATPase catalytic subunit A/Vma1